MPLFAGSAAGADVSAAAAGGGGAAAGAPAGGAPAFAAGAPGDPAAGAEFGGDDIYLIIYATLCSEYRDVLKLSTPFRGYLYCAYIATVGM